MTTTATTTTTTTMIATTTAAAAASYASAATTVSNCATDTYCYRYNNISFNSCTKAANARLQSLQRMMAGGEPEPVPSMIPGLIETGDVWHGRVDVGSSRMCTGAPTMASNSGQFVAGLAVGSVGGATPAPAPSITNTPPSSISKPSPSTPSPNPVAKGFTPVGLETQRMLGQTSKESLHTGPSQDSLAAASMARALTETWPDTQPEPHANTSPSGAPSSSPSPAKTTALQPGGPPRSKGKGHGMGKRPSPKKGFVPASTLAADQRVAVPQANAEPKLEGYWRSCCLNVHVCPYAVANIKSSCFAGSDAIFGMIRRGRPNVPSSCWSWGPLRMVVAKLNANLALLHVGRL